ncbi:MAG: MATE family efflux transporter [Cyclobacteriaceae bacterium]|nr:MATE family efflux transporter [Cyclobacteriaceae bacterium]
MKVFTKTVSIFNLFKEAIKGSEQSFTDGSINRAIFMLSIPMVLEMAMESLLAVVDIFFISRLNNNDAVTAVGLTESVTGIIYSLAMGLGMAATAMVARRIGEKDSPGAAIAAVNALYIGLVLSFIISIVGIFFYQDILRLMGASEQIIQVGSGYTLWMLGGNVTIVALFLINAIFRGAGNAAIAMHSLWIANILNMILDPILIFGWGPIPSMGVEGAAIATNIGRAAGVMYQLYYLRGDKGIIKINKENIKIDYGIIVKLIKIASGNVGQFLISTASWLFLARIIVTFGSAAFAGYQIAIRVIIFTILPSWGMANAAATLVGQNLGAQKPERAEESVWKAGVANMVFLGLISIVFYFVSEPIMRFFTSDPEAIKYGTECLRIVAFGYVFFGYGMVVVQSFNGAGDTRTPTILNLFTYWFFQVPLAYVMAIKLDFGASGAFWAIAIAESVLAVIAILIFRRGKWKNVKI